jgi:hypothetical protein
VVLNGKSQGASWASSTPFGTGSATSIAFGGGTIAYVGVNGSGGGVFACTDLGSATFTFATTSFPETEVLSVATAVTSRSTVFAGTNGQGVGVYVSTNAGSSWTASGSGLGNTTVNAIAIDQTNAMNVYVATAAGVYKSTDGGTMWTLSGLASDNVIDVAVLNGTPSTIYAITASGLYVNKASGD